MEYNPKTIMKCVISRAAVWVFLLAAFALSSCNNDDRASVPSNDLSGHLLLSASLDDGWQETTRGERVEKELEESFGLFAYTYGSGDSWNGGSGKVPDMLCDQEVTMVPEGWATTSLITLPEGDATKMQFFAYYPYRNPELATEEFQFLTSRPKWEYSELTNTWSGDTGNPEFGYLTADNAVDQLDFLVGVSCEYTKSATFFNTPVKLKFKHMLSGIVFKVGSGFTESMTINSISLTNVCKEGKLTVTPPNPDAQNYDSQKPYDTATFSWDNLTHPGTVSVKVDFPVKRIEPNENPNKTDVGKIMNSDELVMFLIPQILSDNTAPEWPSNKSYIELVVNDGVHLTAELNSTELKMGKITVFTISVTSLMKLSVSTSIIDWNSNDDNIFGGSAQEGNAVTPTSEILDWGAITPENITMQQTTEQN